MITIEQLRAARAWLGMNQKELAAAAGISTGTLNNIERGIQTDSKLSTLRALEQALQVQGISLTQNDNGDYGLLFRGKRKTHRTILIIDDNVTDRTLYKAWLAKDEAHKYQILEADNGIRGAEMLVQYNPDCAILDFMMYGKDGFQMLVEMRQQKTRIPPIIFVTAMQNDALKADVMAVGVNAYLDKKTLTQEILVAAVSQAI